MSSKTVIEKQLIIRFLAANRICLMLNRPLLLARLKSGFTVCVKITVKYSSLANISFSLKISHNILKLSFSRLIGEVLKIDWRNKANCCLLPAALLYAITTP